MSTLLGIMRVNVEIQERVYAPPRSVPIKQIVEFYKHYFPDDEKLLKKVEKLDYAFPMRYIVDKQKCIIVLPLVFRGILVNELNIQESKELYKLFLEKKPVTFVDVGKEKLFFALDFPLLIPASNLGVIYHRPIVQGERTLVVYECILPTRTWFGVLGPLPFLEALSKVGEKIVYLGVKRLSGYGRTRLVFQKPTPIMPKIK